MHDRRSYHCTQAYRHDERLELAARELAAELEQIEQRGSCSECLAALMLMVALRMRQGWPGPG